MSKYKIKVYDTELAVQTLNKLNIRISYIDTSMSLIFCELSQEEINVIIDYSWVEDIYPTRTFKLI